MFDKSEVQSLLQHSHENLHSQCSLKQFECTRLNSDHYIAMARPTAEVSSDEIQVHFLTRCNPSAHDMVSMQ